MARTWLRGQDLHLGLEVMSLRYYRATSPRNSKRNWSGWQELNLRGHLPKTFGVAHLLHPQLQRVSGELESGLFGKLVDEKGATPMVFLEH